MANISIDLNLYRIFQALMREGKVSAAADALGLSQPAVSHALAKLRAAFGDPLFVRTRHGMKPTSRAMEMADAIDRGLAILASTQNNQAAFDPGKARGRIRLVMADDTQALVLPLVTALLEREAPGIQLETYKLDPDSVFEDLESARRDLAFGAFPASPTSIYRQNLYREHFACVVRQDHPRIGDSLTLDLYTQVPHILICPLGRPTKGLVDDALAKKGRRRNVAHYVPEFLAAPLIVERTDYILTLSNRIAHMMARMAAIKILEPPIELPSYPVDQIWHGTTHHDPLLSWFRRRVYAVFREEGPPGAPCA